MKHVFIARVSGTPGFLSRVEALFRRQSVPVESLSYSAEEERISVVARASAETAVLLAKQLRRLVDVEDLLEPAVPSAHRHVHPHREAARAAAAL